MSGEPIDIDRLIHEPARLLIVTYLAVIGSSDFLFLSRQTGLTVARDLGRGAVYPAGDA